MVDFKNIKTTPVKEIKHIEHIEDFPDINKEVEILNNKELIILAEAIKKAKETKKQIILMMGGHVVKTGMSQYIIDLMKKGYITHIATPGSTSIHDFEIAYAGETSEDVKEELKQGNFGFPEETGKYMNQAINQAEDGYGYAIGKKIEELNAKHKENSLFYTAYKLNIPATVHSAIGTDIIHMHPECNGEKLGKATYRDFEKFTETVSKLENGVVINLGCAVIMPEVFLKALSICRNLNHEVKVFTAANLDQIKHYRPTQNVVERPTLTGGVGINITAKHQETVPTLYKLITYPKD